MENFTEKTELKMNNGTPNPAGFIDSRVSIFVDPMQVETWELMVLETAVFRDILMIFARYLCRGEIPVSPDLPNIPLDELTTEQRELIEKSDAYKLLKRFKLAEIKGAARAFIEQAQQGFR